MLSAVVLVALVGLSALTAQSASAAFGCYGDMEKFDSDDVPAVGLVDVLLQRLRLHLRLLGEGHRLQRWRLSRHAGPDRSTATTAARRSCTRRRSAR